MAKKKSQNNPSKNDKLLGLSLNERGGDILDALLKADPIHHTPNLAEIIFPKGASVSNEDSDSKDAELFKTGESLNKMSQPRITFPGLPKTPSRPDQQVKVVTEPKEGRLAIKLAEARELVAMNKEKGTNYKKFNRSNASQAEKLNSKRTSKLGFLVPYPRSGPVAVAHNPASAEHKAGEHLSQFLGRLEQKGGKELREKGAKHLASKISESSLVDYNKHFDRYIKGAKEDESHFKEKGMTEEAESAARRSKTFESVKADPELAVHSIVSQAGAPKSKRTNKGKNVPKDAQKIRNAVAPDNYTVEHEGLHYLMAHVQRKHGWEFKHKLVGHLISQLHPDDVSAIRAHMKIRGYKHNDHEEVLTHARDMLVSKDRRENFNQWVEEGKKKGGKTPGRSLYSRGHDTSPMEKLDMKRLKSGWKKVVSAAKKIKPDSFK